jgi:hypothetical protein
MEALLLQFMAEQKAANEVHKAAIADLAKEVAASRAEAAASRVEAVASRVEAVASRAEVKELKSVVSALQAQLAADDGVSAATPKEYEDAGRIYITGELERRFGLRAVLGASPHRLEGDIREDVAPDFRTVEWNYRMPVTVSAPPTHPGKAADFLIFRDLERYAWPARPVTGMHLTPTKTPGAAALPVCDYMAIFEIAWGDSWAKGSRSLLPRLEERLRVSLDRARAFSKEIDGILNVCAVVGVLSPFPCQDSVGARINAAAHPLLFEMMGAGRFVFLRKERFSL